MRYLIGCMLSALLASLFTIWMNSPPHADKSATAEDFPQQGLSQQRVPQQGPRFLTDENNVTPFLNEEGGTRSPLPARGNFRPPEKHAEQIAEEEPLSWDDAIAVRVYEKGNKSAVNITTKSTRTDVFQLMEYTSEGSGSGVVLDKSGHVLTNYHVIEKAVQVGVTLFNGKTYDATLVGGDSLNDLAVLKIDATPDVLIPVELGDSRRLKVGMRVFAIGNPFGLERTMTTGIISSLNRSLHARANRSIRSIIQIDAAVNPGNSGGPLLDTKGRLIGINVAIATKTGQSAGVGFAIPVNLVARVAIELIKHGRFIRPECGIRRVYETEKGLLVAQVEEKGPAADAGLRGPKTERVRRGPFTVERVDRSVADLIVQIDNQPTKTADDFLSYIESKRAGDRVVLTIIRDEKTIQVPLVLAPGE